VGSVADLVAFARQGEKPRAAWRVGTEHEKIGLQRGSLRPVPYEGENGIAGVLAAVAAENGWSEVREAGALIALEGEGASITLEPGGQLELSGAPLRTIFETCAELHRHLDVIRRVSEPRGIVWVALGAHPFSDVHETPSVPKARYTVMRKYLPAHGELALHMMHLCATVQANFDYASEADMATKLRTAMGISPIVSALFANSPLHLGKPSGYPLLAATLCWPPQRSHLPPNWIAPHAAHTEGPCCAPCCANGGAAAVAATRVSANRTRDRQETTWWPGTGESRWESLPPPLCVGAPGGHLARRWSRRRTSCDPATPARDRPSAGSNANRLQVARSTDGG
jgi:hypothetical protein